MPEETSAGGWSDWRTENCKSGCIQKSQGYIKRRRSCDNPSPKNSDCIGNSFDVQLCKDEKLCKRKRKSVTDFATIKCGLFSKKLPELDGKGSGLQAPHEFGRPWMGCAIFCRRKDIASYYTPRIELNDLGLDPYFPDGTWCHYEEGQHYFCRQHHCLPENFHFGKDFSIDIKNDYFNLPPQNAYPGDRKIPDELIKYLSLDLNGKPLLTTLAPMIINPDEEWYDDYLQLPESAQKESVRNDSKADNFLYDLQSMFM